MDRPRSPAIATLLALTACAAPPPDEARDAFVISALAIDNDVWARREPAYLTMKLAKMQRSPFEWLRGTAGVFWRDLTTPGAARAATAFGDPAASRVLLTGDPHPENLGTFRASDGAFVVDWNDFDAAGYGPFEGDVRRLGAGMIIAAASDPGISGDLARAVAAGYIAQIASLARGEPATAVGEGASPYLDKQITKARDNGDAGKTLAEDAPVGADGMRAFAFGDLDPVGSDGVIETRLEPVDAQTAVMIDAAIASWRTTLPGVDPAQATVKLRARRLGAGVSSYAALRYYVVIEGATAATDDDVLLELKEERDGVIIPGVPQLDAAAWTSPAARVVDAQRRLQARVDEDVKLGAGEIAPLALRVHEETAYQRGVNADDLAKLAAGSDGDREELRALAQTFGGLLARAHGAARDADGELGWTVIAPLLAGREAAFADEIAAMSEADAAQTTDDWQRLEGRDLAALVLPVSEGP